MKRILFLIIVGSIMFAPVLNAQGNTRGKLAEELLVLIKVKENIERAFDMIKQMQMGQLKQLNIQEMDSEKFASSQEKIMDVIAKEMNWENLKADYIKIYAETFTEEELKGFIAFYKTPVGKKFIEKQPELMQKSMQISQKQMRTLMPKIQKLTQEMIKSSEVSQEDVQ